MFTVFIPSFTEAQMKGQSSHLIMFICGETEAFLPQSLSVSFPVSPPQPLLETFL